MSRSKRRTPIFGIASFESEKPDKKIWHARMRSRVKTGLASTPSDQLEGYVAPTPNKVGSVWSMAKDGKRYFSPEKQKLVAARISARGKSSVERQSLKIRLLRKWAMK